MGETVKTLMGCGAAPKEDVAVHRIEEIYGIELPAAALAPPGLPTEQFDVTVNLPHRQVQIATSEQQVGALVKMKLHEDFPSEIPPPALCRLLFVGSDIENAQALGQLGVRPGAELLLEYNNTGRHITFVDSGTGATHPAVVWPEEQVGAALARLGENCSSSPAAPFSLDRNWYIQSSSEQFPSGSQLLIGSTGLTEGSTLMSPLVFTTDQTLLPAKLNNNSVVTFSGTGHAPSVDLQAANGDTYLQFNPRKATRKVVRNAKLHNGDWQQEEADGGYPFIGCGEIWNFSFTFDVVNQTVIFHVDSNYAAPFGTFKLRSHQIQDISQILVFKHEQQHGGYKDLRVEIQNVAPNVGPMVGNLHPPAYTNA